jgi:hypothetical protein
MEVKNHLQVQLRTGKKMTKSCVDDAMYLLLAIESKGGLC